MKSSPRRVVRNAKQARLASSHAKRTARTVNSAHQTKTVGGKIRHALNPHNIKAYWFSRQGALMAAKIAGVGLVFLIGVFLWFGKDLPNPNKINAKLGAQTTKFWDRTHTKVLYEVYGDKNRSLISFDQMPKYVKEATISVEDKNFYKHGAFSVFGIGRAFTGVVLGSNRGGGSTITQQYVKNALLTDQRSLSRKIKELILAIEIEQRYSKDDILKLYLNEIPYGSQAYGIQTAAKTYFNKDAKDLTLDESATLAAMPQAPSYYSPYGPNTGALIGRRDHILDLMEAQGYITEAQATAAKKTDTLAKVQPRQSRLAGVTAPHFVLYAQDYLSAKYGDLKVTEGGLDVTTSLDLDKQKAAEEAVSQNMKGVRSLGGTNASLTAGDPKTGQIYAMVGSYDFNDPKFGAVNVANSLRQPGSSFKPFAYSTLMGKNYGPGTTIYDVKTDFGGGYVPKNFSNKFYGVQSLRTALDGSLNIPAVKVLYMAGIQNTINTAKSMGITTLNQSPDTYGLSLVLGSGEVKLVDMVNAYESFANGGVHYDSTPIVKVVDPSNKVIEDNSKPEKPKKVLDPQVAYLMANVMSDNSARAYIFGQNNPLTLPGRTVAAKTGTTTDYKDAWTVGYTPSLVAGVWAGNNDGAPMSAEAADVAAPVWNSFMKKVLTGPNEQFAKPAGIQQITLDATTGRLASAATKQKRTDLFPSWYKAAPASDVGGQKIDKVSGKVATSCTPPLAIQDGGVGNILPEIPSTDPSYNRWNSAVQAGLGFSYGAPVGGSGASDDKHNCSDTKPSISVSAANSGGGNYTITARATSGTFAVKTIEVRVDDQVIGTKTTNGSDTYTLSYNASGGSHTVKATAIDEVLYTADDTTTINGSGSGITPISVQTNNLGVAFTWRSDGSSNYRVYVDGQPHDYSGTSSGAIGAAPGNHTYRITSAKGADESGSFSN